MSNGCSAAQVAAIRAAEVRTESVESDLSTFHRLTRGSILHRRDCPAISGKETVPAHHSLLSVAGNSMHAPCTRWRGLWSNETIRRTGTILLVAEIVTETESLKGRKEPAFTTLAKLLHDLRTEETSDAFQVAYGDTERYDQTLKDLLALEKEWEGAGSTERAAACVVQAITCPRSSLKHLGATHDKAWRLATTGWAKWQEVIGAERPFSEAHLAAEKAIVSAARKMARAGETVRPEDTSGIRTLTKSWERTLKAAASSAEGEVLLVANGGYHLVLGRSPVAAAAAAFPSAKNVTTGTVALRCPTQVADWLTDMTDRWQAKALRVLGPVTEQDTPAVLETLVAVWDPRAGGQAASPYEALKAARALAG